MKKYILIVFLALTSLVTRAQIDGSSKAVGPLFQNGSNPQIQVKTSTGYDTLYSKRTGQIDSLLALRAKKAHLDSLANGTASFSGLSINGSNGLYLLKNNTSGGSALTAETVTGSFTISDVLNLALINPTGDHENFHFFQASLPNGFGNADINIGLPNQSGYLARTVDFQGGIDTGWFTKIRLTAGATTNYVWTATDNLGNGHWAPPGGGTSINFADNEIPSGVKNGVNVTFTLAHTPIAGSVKLYLNAGRDYPTDDFTVSGNTITFVIAPLSTDKIITDYRY